MKIEGGRQLTVGRVKPAGEFSSNNKYIFGKNRPSQQTADEKRKKTVHKQQSTNNSQQPTVNSQQARTKTTITNKG